MCKYHKFFIIWQNKDMIFTKTVQLFLISDIAVLWWAAAYRCLFLYVVCIWRWRFLLYEWCMCKVSKSSAFSKRRHIALQKVPFYTLKGHLLETKRWPFATRWATACYKNGCRWRAFCLHYGRRQPALRALCGCFGLVRRSVQGGLYRRKWRCGSVLRT